MIHSFNEIQLQTLYQQHMIQDFPPNELKPLNQLLLQHQQNKTFWIGYSVKQQLCGYAILAKGKQQRCLLLDYFAIFSDMRSHGCGTAFLHELKAVFSNWQAILIEAEAAQTETAQKRLHFYQQNGARKTAIQLRLYEVDYHVLVLPLAASLCDEEALENLQDLYQSLYSETFRRAYLDVSL